MHALLTVGSTQFPALVEASLQPAFLSFLSEQGYLQFTIQHGTCPLPDTLPSSATTIVKAVQFISDIDTVISSADLIISHAGKSVHYSAVQVNF